MTTSVRLLVALAAGLFLALPAAAADDPVVATINGQPVTEAELTLVAGEMEAAFKNLPDDKKRAAALSAVIEIRMMAAEAEKAAIDKDPATALRLSYLRQRALHSAYIDQQLAPTVTDAEIRARYDQEIAATPPVMEVRASHILVDTAEKAAEIIKQLDGGADFAELAKANSKDGSAAEGGDLGFFGPGRMVAEFEKAAFALEIGAHTKEPVQSQFGFHVIKVTDRRQQLPPPYEEVKEQVKGLVLTEKYFALIKSLRDATAVEVGDPALKAALDEIEAQKVK
ncbi:MAG: peptidylprolyl isomerase [Rhizobiaceae bacterium]